MSTQARFIVERATELKAQVGTALSIEECIIFVKETLNPES